MTIGLLLFRVGRINYSHSLLQLPTLHSTHILNKYESIKMKISKGVGVSSAVTISPAIPVNGRM